MAARRGGGGGGAPRGARAGSGRAGARAGAGAAGRARGGRAGGAGCRGDRRVVPPAWVEASVLPRARSRWSGQQYGYGWWIREVGGGPADFARGVGGPEDFAVAAA